MRRRARQGWGRLLPRVLREQVAFRRYWTGQTVSLFGDQVSLIALPLVAVLVLHAGAAQMGVLSAAALLPNLIFSLHAGAWADRLGRRRRLMIAADCGRALVLATVPLAAALGLLTMAQLYAVAFVTGTLSVVFLVCASSLFVSLVPRDRFVEANSAMFGSRALSFVAGPSAGGLLVQLASAPVALLADAASFVVSALCLGSIRPVEPPTEPAGTRLVRSGVRFVLATPFMRASLAATATINFGNFIYNALVILYLSRSLHLQPGLLGAIFGTGSVGSIAGSLLAARLSRRIGIGRAFLLGCVLFPLPLVLVPLATGPEPLVIAMLLAAYFGAGLGVMVLDIAYGSITAALVPARLRSRVSGAYMVVNYGVRPAGAALGGVLGTVIGLRPTLLAATVVAALGFLWLLASPVPRLRELPEPAEP